MRVFAEILDAAIDLIVIALFCASVLALGVAVSELRAHADHCTADTRPQ